MVKTGVGAVNAALSLGLLIDRYPVDAVILIGVGGALSPILNIGDVVVANSVIQHDFVHTAEEGQTLMSPGELFLSRTIEEQFSNPIMATNSALSQLIIPGDHDASYNVHRGTIVSGGEFVASSARKTYLHNLHGGALLVDMEAAGVAQVCRKLGIPFAVAKTVADRLTPDGTISSDYLQFLNSAANRAGLILERILSL